MSEPSIAEMLQEELSWMLGAALVSAGGEVPLDHVESLLRENYGLELPNISNHAMLEKYLLTNFSNICRVKKAPDGHFVVRVLHLPSISHLLPAGYVEPEFEPLTPAEIQNAVTPRSSEATDTQTNGIVRPQPNAIVSPQLSGAVRPQLNTIVSPQLNGAVRPQPNVAVRPQTNGVQRPQPHGVVRPQPNGTTRPQTGGAISLKPEGATTRERRGAPGPQTSGAPTPRALLAPPAPSTATPTPPTIKEPTPTPATIEEPTPHENKARNSEPKDSPSPQPNRFLRAPSNDVPGGTLLNNQKHSGRKVVRSEAAVKTPRAAPRPRFDPIFTKNEYQDDQDDATILANLENQLLEECSVRGIIEPTFKLTTYGREFKEVYCMASWGNEKIQSHPGVFATEEGAKTNVIKKMLIGMDEFARKLMSYQSDEIAENQENRSTSQTPDRDSPEEVGGSTSPVVSREGQLVRSNDHILSQGPETGTKSPDLEQGDIVPEESMYIREDFRSPNDIADSVCSEPEKATQLAPTAPWKPPSSDKDPLIINHSPVDLEPRIDMEQPVSQGYLTHISADGSFMVQVKGAGLARWERQTYAFDPHTPTKKIIPFRWCVVNITEGADVDFFDRAMCISEDGPHTDKRGFVQLYFPDNGYEAFVDPNMVFDLENYEEINRVPIQAVRIHAVGLTGKTPVEELRATHPPHNQLLFLPTDRSNCFMVDCAADVPHVYVYDIDLKRVLC